MHILLTAWLIALVTSIWFGLAAYLARRVYPVWFLSGGLFGLVIATLVLGVAQAEFIPYTHHHATTFVLKWTLLAMFCVVLLGSLFTAGLCGYDRLWRRNRPSEGQKPVVL